MDGNRVTAASPQLRIVRFNIFREPDTRQHALVEVLQSGMQDLQSIVSKFVVQLGD